ncbi:Scr1 family TA system antitoxin-like transcriptional regulator [Embleya sp. NPDC050154]|uniref:helix-turn-helix domain-containing protein n=1 Tax=Embleya sp. NPDC050154 TaxID=3363988 RepID=UPI00379B4F48
MAAQIREHRTRAGMSVTELADVVGYSKASMSRFETCDSPVPEELCPKLDAAFGTNGLFTALFEMLRGVRFPDRYLEYMSLENEALSLGEWAGLYIPGLLQTPAYARTLFQNADLGATDEELDVRVAARMGRRHIFDRESGSYFMALIDQAVLYRWIGGAEVMRAQLESLLALMDHEHGMIRVLPYRNAGFGISDVTQIVVELEDVTVVYVEGACSDRSLKIRTPSEYVGWPTIAHAPTPLTRGNRRS